MSELSKQALKVENNASFPNNNAGYITPTILRNFNNDIIDSMVVEPQYNADSASWNATDAILEQQVAALEAFTASIDTAFVSTAEFNTYTQSVDVFEVTTDGRLDSLEAATSSYADSASVATSLQYIQNEIDALDPSGSAQAVASLNEFTASQLTINSGYNSYTASNNVSINALNSFTSSQTSINSGVNTFTASANQRLTAIESVSGSWVTESETGSFAKVDVSNTFTADQTINGTLNVTTINATTIHTIIESSSVIFSSGSNILGDELTDTQTLSGSVKVQGSLTINGTPVQTSSVDISALNQATASLQTFTASAQISIDNLNSTTASLNTSVSNLNTFTASQDLLNDTFATTGSNTFSGVQTISTSTGTPLIVDHKDATTQNTFIGFEKSGSAKWDIGNLGTTDSFGIYNPATFAIPLTINQDNSVILLGALTASLTEGYAWVGNGSNVSTLVSTASFGTPTNLGPLNAFTASQELLNTTFATTGSNVFKDTQVISGSINVSGSINLAGEGANGFAFSGKALFLTNSVQTGITIESPIHFYQASKGDMYIQNNVAGVGSGSLNVVVSNNTFKIAADSGVNLNKTDGAGSAAAGGNVNFNVHSGSLFLTPNGYNVNTASMLHVSSSSNTNNVNLIFKSSNNTADTILSGSGNIFTNPTAAAAGFKRYIGSYNTFLTPTSAPAISGSMAFSPTVNGNIGGQGSPMFTFRGPVSSSTWTVANNMLMGTVMNIGTSAANHGQGVVAGLSIQGNVGNGNMQVIANKSNLTQALVIQANNLGGTTTLTAASSSVVLQGNTIQGLLNINNLASGSGAAIVSSSNALYNWQNIIGGGLTVTATGSSDPGDTSGIDYMRAMERNVIVGTSNLVQLDGQFTGSNTLSATAILGGNLTVTGSNASTNTSATITNQGSAFVGRFNAQDGNRAKSAQTVFAVGTGTSSERKTGFLIDSGSNTFVEGTLNVSGSTTIQTLTASLAEGYVWVGNGSGITTTVATSSFGGGGGAAFPYTGSAQITGSLGITGSVSGLVNSLAIASNTASMNFNDGNFFTLQLVSGSTTHLTATNIKPGQAINLLVKTDSGSAGASGSLTFSSDFKFAGGFDYTPTAVTASQDLVSFVTFDTTQIFAGQIKNLS